MPSSRYQRRPLVRERLVFTVRDLEVLNNLHNHRFMQAAHFRWLCFRHCTLRVVQARLAKLWQHGYLDRHFVPFTLDGTKRAPSEAATPVYTLGKRGQAVLMQAAGATASRLDDRARTFEVAPVTLAHHLVVTDLTAAIEGAMLARGTPDQATTEHEFRLWQRAHERVGTTSGLIVPDGAVTFASHDGRAPETWYVEVVKAGIALGNNALRTKMLRYLELRAQGRFEGAFGHARVRGVLIAAPTHERARRLRALAASLPSARRFFAFTHFEDRKGEQRLRRFTPETVLDLAWTDGAGGVVRLGHPGDRTA